MRNQKKLLVEQLDQKLKAFKTIENVSLPRLGWINTIRTGLNMSLEQLGKRLGMTKQGAKKVEEREASGSISIKLLKEVGNALNMRLVYGFIPIDGSLEKMVDIRAHEIANRVIQRTNQNMKLENQGNNEQRILKAVEDFANEIKWDMRKSLWD